MPLFSSKPKDPVSVKDPRTLLSTLLTTNRVTFPITPYNGTTVTFGSTTYPLNEANAKKVFGQYEAALTQACYFSRLIYTPNEVAAIAAQFIHYNPVVFNTALSIVRGNYSRLFANKPSVSQVLTASFNVTRNDSAIVKVPNQIHKENQDGLFLNGRGKMDDTPCYFQYLDYSAKSTGVPFPKKRVLYITFRGTLTLGGAVADANIASLALEELLKLCTLRGMSGLDAFQEEVAAGRGEGARGVAGVVAAVATIGLLSTNPFGAHQGFVRQMKNIMGAVCEALDKKFLKLPIDHIIVTGHSLGAANAALASLVLGGFKRKANIATDILQFGCLRTATLHCITFGGPKCLTDYSRNVYNKLLTDGIMTLDRVANRASAAKQAFSALASAGLGLLSGASADLVALIPANFNHPGFMPGKGQFYTQSKMGMSNNISDLRQMFAGTSPPSSLSFTGGTFNGIPLYEEFLACFIPIPVTKTGSASQYDINTVYAAIIGKTGTLGFWQKSSFPDEYAAIKTLVERVTGRPVANVEENPQTSAAGEAAVFAVSPAAAAAAEANEASPQPVVVGGSHTSNYKKLRDEIAGSNQITYSPQMVVSPASAHLNYMGVGWNGAVKDAQHIRHACQEIQYGNAPIKPYCVSHTTLTGQEAPVVVSPISNSTSETLGAPAPSLGTPEAPPPTPETPGAPSPPLGKPRPPPGKPRPLPGNLFAGVGGRRKYTRRTKHIVTSKTRKLRRRVSLKRKRSTR